MTGDAPPISTPKRSAKTALVEEQIASSELVRQLHSNRGALRALYPRERRRLASYFPPSHSRAAGEADVEDADGAPRWWLRNSRMRPSTAAMLRLRSPATLPAMADPSQLLQDALTLPPRERAELAEAIMASLDGFDLEDEWEEEIQRRVDEVAAGRVQPLPGEEVLSRLERRLCAVVPE